ncbi:hypothetical protein [Stenotrophomonas maltophilia]|uniref:Uncharacterized protein n=1 Tax=Stenotrophomonas maltophilia TaxID=40324 RepID=A0A4S2D272_STEMA|nr:hypothetical protein [Stenotrophomonas maltophilia]TGY35226.1 hypothetical protein E5352_05765 [Stenotrophomonas maltophilia]
MSAPVDVLAIPATRDLFEVRDELVEKMAASLARVFYRHELERLLERWRLPVEMMKSWGASDSECKLAAQQALSFADVSLHAPPRYKGGAA